MYKSLKHETIFYGISKYTNVFVTLLTTSVLSRILNPSEFGVVSVVTVFTAFFSVLSDMGLGAAVIQNKTLSENEINDIFSFSIYMALGLGILFALLGAPISVFYGDPVYRKVCLLLSVSVLFNAANIIPNAVLMKHKLFRSVGKRLIFASVFSGIVAIVLALGGFGYYAIIAQSVFQAIFIFLWNVVKTSLKFHLRFHFESVKRVRQYSFYQFLYSIINYFARNLDNLLIGKVLGSESLAYYDKGYRLMMYPVQNLTYVINPIVHPVLSEYQNNKKYIYTSYMKIVRVLSLMGVFLSFFCFWASEEIVMIFFGSQWADSVPVFRLLSLSVWPQLVSTSAGSIYQSTGNTKLMFKSGAVHFTTTILLILLGVFSGSLNTVALFVAVSLYLRFFIDYYVLVVKDFGYKYITFLKEFRSDLIIMLAMILMIFAGNMLIDVDGILWSLILKALMLGVVFLAAAVLTGQLSYLLSLIKKKSHG